MAGLAVPLIVWTAGIVLACMLVNRQTLFKRAYWTVPVWVSVHFALVMLLRLLTVALL